DTARAVSLGRLCGNQHHPRPAVAIALPDELNELEPVDVRHVDVRDHEVVAAPGEQPERVEAALRLDHLDTFRPESGLQGRPDEPPGTERIFDDENARHEAHRARRAHVTWE